MKQMDWIVSFILFFFCIVEIAPRPREQKKQQRTMHICILNISIFVMISKETRKQERICLRSRGDCINRKWGRGDWRGTYYQKKM